MLIIDDGDVDCVDDDDIRTALWIFNPKMNDDVPIKKETVVRIFPVRPGIKLEVLPGLFAVVVVVSVVVLPLKYYYYCPQIETVEMIV